MAARYRRSTEKEEGAVGSWEWAVGLNKYMTDIKHLRNLGPKSAEWLIAAGIETIADLRRLGAVAAFQLVRQQQPRASLNLLWALAAGLEDRDWRELLPEEKAGLKQQASFEMGPTPSVPTRKNPR